MSKESEKKNKPREVTWDSPRDPRLGDTVEEAEKKKKTRDL